MPHTKGLKLLRLYQRGVGGERDNAGRLLLTHLRAHDLTLYDLDPSLPVTQDLAALGEWRESAALLTRLGTPQADDVLTQLVDAEDLTPVELQRLLDHVDLERLANVRLDGWAYALGLPAPDLRQAARQVTPAHLLQGTGSLTQRFQHAIQHAHWTLTHPERLIRAADPLTQHLILGFVQGLTGHAGRPDPEGVRAHLNADELARLRTLLAQHAPRLREQALHHAQQLARQSTTRSPA